MKPIQTQDRYRYIDRQWNCTESNCFFLFFQTIKTNWNCTNILEFLKKENWNPDCVYTHMYV